MRVKAKYIPEFAVVRLDDGRIGVLEHKTTARQSWVRFGDTAQVVKSSDGLEVVKYPAELAFEYVQAHTTGVQDEQAQQ